jgi:hypothetical protein
MSDLAGEIARLRQRLRLSRETVALLASDIMELEGAAEKALLALSTVEPTTEVLSAKARLRRALEKGEGEK